MTKDNELSQELDKMKFLMARMGEKINGLKKSHVGSVEEYEEGPTDQEKVENVLDFAPC